MRPIRLVMSAFGPFGDCQTVDFEKMGRGLFLISGDTGAGKTTIFDGISFALFGAASGENRTNGSFCSGFADGMTPTFVELDFLHKGKAYHIRRNPDYKRPAKRGSKMVMEKRDALLILPNGETVTDFDKVTASVKALLGVDWRQFKQIAMIAQGEFLRLLTADSAERGMIFRKAFGTEHLEAFQRELAERCNRLRKQCEDTDKSIMQYLEGILATEEWERRQELLQAKKAKAAEKLEELLADCLNAQQKQYEQYEAKADELQHQMLAFMKMKSDAEYLSTQIQELHIWEQKRIELRQQESEFIQKTKQYEAGVRAFYHTAPAVIACKNAKEQMEKQQNALDEIERVQECLKQQQKEISENYRMAKEQEPIVGRLNMEIEKGEQELLVFFNIEKLKEALEKLAEQKKRAEEAREQCQQYQSCLRKEINERNTENECYAPAEAERERIAYQLKENWDMQSVAEEVLKKLCGQKQMQQRLESAQQIYMRSEASWQLADQKLREGNNRFRQEIAGILAETLKEGEPCPVCGSVVHPDLRKKTQETLSKEQLETLEHEEQQLRQKRDRSLNQCSEWKTELDLGEKNIRKEMTEWLRKLKQMQPDENRVEKDAQESEKSERIETELMLRQGMAQLKWAENRLEQKLVAWKEQIEKKQKNIERISELEAELLKIQKEIDDLDESLAALNYEEIQKSVSLAGLNESLHFSDKTEGEIMLEKNKQELTRLQEKIKWAEECFQKFQSEKSELEGEKKQSQKHLLQLGEQFAKAKEAEQNALKKQGFSSIEEFEQAFLDEPFLDDLKQKIEEYKNQVKEAEERISHLKKDIGGKKQPDLEALSEWLERAEKEKAAADTIKQQIAHCLHTNQSIQKNVSEKTGRQQEFRKQYLLIKTLSDTANGELSGKQKVRFEQYVQAFYFRKVIREANKRFRKVSGGQFELRYLEDNKDKRSKTGLELEVMDYYTGMLRAVTSLSGGESFQAALSLALGLSDVIQHYAGGIEVDALFIDEGFGTLDETALEQAIETLSELADSERMVGIISHVNELKDCIEQQVLVKKGRNGSKIEIQSIVQMKEI